MYTSPTTKSAAGQRRATGEAVEDEYRRQDGETADQNSAPPEAGRERSDREGPDDGPDTLGRCEQAGRRCDPARSGMGQTMRHDRNERDERRGRKTYERNRSYRSTAARFGARRTGTEAKRSEQSGLFGASGRRGQADEEERHHDGEERRRVGDEGNRVPEGGDRHTSECRSDNASEVELCRVERDRGEELLLRHQVRRIAC